VCSGFISPGVVQLIQFFQEGYNIYRNDRNLNGGGVLIAVKDTYICTRTPNSV
jgi:hypothetical protein